MEKTVSRIAALGVPGLIFMVIVKAAGGGFLGCFAALHFLGPGGFVGGLATLGVMTLITEAITKYGFESLCHEVIAEMLRHGETKESILSKIKASPISSDLKRKLREQVYTTKATSIVSFR